MNEAVVATEVRLLEGPNLYFTSPAVKIMLSMPAYLEAPATTGFPPSRRDGASFATNRRDRCVTGWRRPVRWRPSWRRDFILDQG